LPLTLQSELGKNYKDYWITQLFELVNKEGTEYHLTLEKADRIVQLRSNRAEGWEFIRKEPE
jgi:hypothetical protein